MEIRSAKPQLIVVRHGETAWSTLGKHTSHTDLPLTAVGEQSARELKTKLQTHAFTRVFSSPLLRARATAELSGFAEHAVVTSDLTEWNYGDDEGRTTLEIRNEYLARWSTQR
jgi:broad specificity phosphatase PhoE